MDFQFNNGDIITITAHGSSCRTTCILKQKIGEWCYVYAAVLGNRVLYDISPTADLRVMVQDHCIVRLAYESEESEIFQKLKREGYKWDCESKTLKSI
jgi:hypothetical protein